MSVDLTISMTTTFCRFQSNISVDRHIDHISTDTPSHNLYGFLLWDASMNKRT